MSENKEAVVRKALEDFLSKHGEKDALCDIDDEIVLSYMASSLEEVEDDDFSIENFTEMMAVYIPAFEGISSTEITDWMFELAAKLNPKSENGASTGLSFALPQSVAISIEKANSKKQQNSRAHTVSTSSNTSLPESSPHSSVSAASGSSVEDDNMMLSLLTEMFPTVCRLELTHCVSVANGDVDTATELVLDRQESGEAVTQEDIMCQQPELLKGKKHVVDDAHLKKQIVNQYAFVDTTDDSKYHRPMLPKKKFLAQKKKQLEKDKKKMTRYLDSRVVNTRGERYTEVKKATAEEEEKAKKTYINLKPAVKYHFH